MYVYVKTRVYYCLIRAFIDTDTEVLSNELTWPCILGCIGRMVNLHPWNQLLDLLAAIQPRVALKEMAHNILKLCEFTFFLTFSASASSNCNRFYYNV